MRVHTRTLALLALTACSPPVIPDLQPNGARTGEDGAEGPYGVAHAAFQAQARVTDAIDYEVSWPADADGRPDPSGAPYPALVLVHGGLVEAPKYRWLATHFASRGYVVVLPAHPLDLAIFESDNASIALADARRRSGRDGPLTGALSDEPALILGHSLGAVIATFRWVSDPDDFLGVGLLAGWAAQGTPVEEQAGRPSLSIIGSEDRSGEATAEAFEQYDRYPDPGWFGVVDGMNHYDWADGATDRELAADGVPTRAQSETRRDAVARARQLDRFLVARRPRRPRETRRPRLCRRAGGAVIGLLFGVAMALDPAALRVADLDQYAIAFDFSGNETSMAAGRIAFAASSSAFGAAYGSRTRFTDPERPWAVIGTASGGLALTTVDVAIATSRGTADSAGPRGAVVPTQLVATVPLLHPPAVFQARWLWS